MDDDDLVWTVTSSVAAVGAAMLTRKALSKGWVRSRGKVPGNPATDDTSWNEAMAWAVVSGVAVGVARLLAQRGVAAVLASRRGTLPDKAATTPTA
ncbi:hypothetical protein BH23ACT2_BH23ACT2_21570 [soil metagenome]